MFQIRFPENPHMIILVIDEPTEQNRKVLEHILALKADYDTRGDIYPYGPALGPLYRARIVAPRGLALRSRIGDSLGQILPAGEIVTVYAELESVGPNTAGTSFTNRAVINPISGVNIWMGDGTTPVLEKLDA